MPKFNKVTIVMYHYVRDLKHSRFPKIKGLDLPLFVEQAKYLKKNYSIITMDLLIQAIEKKETLPPKSALLTFDDGYVDHFLNVFPILNSMKLQGSFYIPVKSIKENEVLDVNKLHFILASIDNKKSLLDEVFIELDKYREEYMLQSDQYYLNKLAIPGRYDSKEVMFFKRLLQFELPEQVRTIIVNNIFERIVGINEKSFSKELYMNIEQIKCMKENGMHIGCHGYKHNWLGTLPASEQEHEIREGLDFINEIGANTQNWTMSYPYGDYNQTLIDLLIQYGCNLALTAEVGIADISINDKYTLPRLDTNDIPKNRLEKPNEWYYIG